jgi:hypothetical protein
LGAQPGFCFLLEELWVIVPRCRVTRRIPTPGHEIAGTILDGTSGLADVVDAIEPWVNCQGVPRVPSWRLLPV